MHAHTHTIYQKFIGAQCACETCAFMHISNCAKDLLLHDLKNQDHYFMLNVDKSNYLFFPIQLAMDLNSTQTEPNR